MSTTPWRVSKEITVVDVGEALDGTSLQGFCWPSTFLWSSLGINIYNRVYLPCCQTCNLNMVSSHLSISSFTSWHVIWKDMLSFRSWRFKRIKRFKENMRMLGYFISTCLHKKEWSVKCENFSFMPTSFCKSFPLKRKSICSFGIERLSTLGPSNFVIHQSSLSK